MKTKNEVFFEFQDFKALVENQTNKKIKVLRFNQTNRKIKVLRSNNGGEYTFKDIDAFDVCALMSSTSLIGSLYCIFFS
jgi:hypothetical protein